MRAEKLVKLFKLVMRVMGMILLAEILNGRAQGERRHLTLSL
jgi:hypothetical protein